MRKRGSAIPLVSITLGAFVLAALPFAAYALEMQGELAAAEAGYRLETDQSHAIAMAPGGVFPRLARLNIKALRIQIKAAETRLVSSSSEDIFWQSVQDSKYPAELEAYLKAYPEGKFAPLARIRLERLKKGGTARKSEEAPSASIPSQPGKKQSASQPPPVHDCDRLAALCVTTLRSINSSPLRPPWGGQACRMILAGSSPACWLAIWAG